MDKSQESDCDVDLSHAAKGVWLVKVPNYLAAKWKKVEAPGEIGKLHYEAPKHGGKPNVKFVLGDRLLSAPIVDADTTSVPREHRFDLQKATNQMALFSREPATRSRDSTPLAENEDESKPSEKYAVAGYVVQRAECKPVDDLNYMSLKRKQMEISNKPSREVQLLTEVVVNYKPIAKQTFHLQEEKRRKEEGRRPRDEKDKVLEMLYGAFEKHQYYCLKDLISITKQPVTYLKEILREICDYNSKPPHRSMYELKPEYRHYKTSAAKND